MFDRIEGPLVPAHCDVSIRAWWLPHHRGGGRDGRAMTSAATAPRMALQRVNGFQTLLRFSVQVDADFEFAFGLFDDTGCRSRDAVELKSLGVN